MLWFKSKNDSSSKNKINIQRGSYYTNKENGHYSVFRVIDFDDNVCHVQLFRETYDHPPSLDEVQNLPPYIGHTPISIDSLQKYDSMQLIGHVQLDERSVEGYEEYLKQVTANDNDVSKYIQRLLNGKAEISPKADPAETTQPPNADPVKDWFAQNEMGWLELPNGPFGRPYDTYFVLLNYEQKGNQMSINLGDKFNKDYEGLNLIFSGRGTKVQTQETKNSAGIATETKLIISNFDKLQFSGKDLNGRNIKQNFGPRGGSVTLTASTPG